MICVYPADCTDFSTNGNGTLAPLTAEVTETLNGEYELTLVLSLCSVRFAIVTWLRFRLPCSFAHHTSASLHPPLAALRLRAH